MNSSEFLCNDYDFSGFLRTGYISYSFVLMSLVRSRFLRLTLIFKNSSRFLFFSYDFYELPWLSIYWLCFKWIFLDFYWPVMFSTVFSSCLWFSLHFKGWPWLLWICMDFHALHDFYGILPDSHVLVMVFVNSSWFLCVDHGFIEVCYDVYSFARFLVLVLISMNSSGFLCIGYDFYEFPGISKFWLWLLLDLSGFVWIGHDSYSFFLMSLVWSRFLDLILIFINWSGLLCIGNDFYEFPCIDYDFCGLFLDSYGPVIFSTVLSRCLSVGLNFQGSTRFPKICVDFYALATISMGFFRIHTYWLWFLWIPLNLMHLVMISTGFFGIFMDQLLILKFFLDVFRSVWIFKVQKIMADHLRIIIYT